jgi:hypothetical protein
MKIKRLELNYTKDAASTFSSKVDFEFAPMVASSTQVNFYNITFPTVFIEQLPYL